MKKLFSAVALALISVAFAQVSRPKLVVGIIVDQMKQEYLYRFNDKYQDGGFKRLMNEGYSFNNMHYNYTPTYTAPGHSSVYTGTTPSIHGIVGNTWYHGQEKNKVYCTADPKVQSVGIDPDNKAGKMSPWRLKTTTMTDELRLSTNMEGKVISISVKDRGAILPGGHFANGAFWMDENGKFITSTYYMNELPRWVKKYNQKEMAKKYVKKGWKTLLPIDNYTESLPDNNPYERVFKPKTTPTFPYDLQAIADAGEGLSIVKTSPFGNNMVAELAMAAVDGEDLGKDNTTDFLAISFSSTDYVGHSFAPRSIELEDTYLRLDKSLAELLTFLDKKVGKGNYLLFLTADHAAAENPNFLKDLKYNVESISYSKIGDILKDFSQKKYGENLVEAYYNSNVFLDQDKIESLGLNEQTVITEMSAELEKQTFVSRVYNRKDFARGNITDPNLTKIIRGFDPKQNGDMIVLLEPQDMEYYETGTTHGTTYMYDSHVPALWFGWGIKKGQTSSPKEITEMAPTLSQKINITFPNGTEGKVLEEILE